MKNDAEETPFILAAREGRLHFLEFMYKKYSISTFNPDHRSLDGWTAFTYASINGYVNTVEFLANTVKVNIHTTDRFRRTAIHWAARYNNVSVFELLLSLGLNYQALDCESMTPMELAKAFNADDIVDIILFKQRTAATTIAERGSVRMRRTSPATKKGTSK